MQTKSTENGNYMGKFKEIFSKIEDSSGRSVAPDVPEDLDFLVPKAGFFCPICSLFYSDEQAMTNHCKSTCHKQNTEKFMAKQRKEKEQNESEERSSR